MGTQGDGMDYGRSTDRQAALDRAYAAASIRPLQAGGDSMKVAETKTGYAARQGTGCRDVNGREIFVGDLLRSYHYTGARRSKQYLYHLVIEHDQGGMLSPVAVPVEEFAFGPKGGRFWVLRGKMIHSEIIHGPSQRSEDGSLVTWYERKREKTR